MKMRSNQQRFPATCTYNNHFQHSMFTLHKDDFYSGVICRLLDDAI
jgi:hypothetical protein